MRMAHGTPRDVCSFTRARRAWSTLSLASGLVAGAFAGCGGKAADLDARALRAGLDGARFLASCAQESCMDGFECVAGVCSRSCSEDEACEEVSARARCRQDPTSVWHGYCIVECGSDYGCRNLGAGSNCRRGRCTAGDLQALPEAFERIELRRLDEAALTGSAVPCDPNQLTTRIEINLRARRLSWSACSPEAEDGTGIVTGGAELDDRDIAWVLDEYRQLRPSMARRCERGTPLFTFELEPERGTELLFADAEHSGCEAHDLERGSFVEGVNGFYVALEALKLGMQ
jgi:hypothetical protein